MSPISLMRGALLAGILMLAAVAHTAAAGPDWASLGASPYDLPKPAPAFSLPSLDGRPVALADFRGKVTLVFFWATW